MLPFRLLRVIVAIAHAGSLTEAARRLHQSTASVSRALSQAESALGVVLFQRGARGVVATPEVQALLPRLQRAQQALAPAFAAERSRATPLPTLPRHLTDGMLQALLTVASTRSEAAAARDLGLSQASVHATLRQLEHAVRQRLFDRSTRGTRLTSAGEDLLRQFKLAQAELRMAHEDLAERMGRASPHVVVGALPMAGDALVSVAIARCLAQTPHLRITALDGTYESLVHALRHAEVHGFVGPLREGAAAGDLVEERLFVDTLVPVLRSGHPALVLKPASLAALRRWPWIGPLPNTPAYAAFERVFAAEGLDPPPIGLQTHSTAIVRSVLAVSEHIALLSPWHLRSDLRSGQLRSLPLHLKGTRRAIGITTRRDALPTPAVERLLQTLRDVAAEGPSS
jgi:LysR family transcriptional regulator of gallate degradation